MNSLANLSEHNAWITPIDREKWLLRYATNESERKALEAVELGRRQKDPAEALGKLDDYEKDNTPTAVTAYYRYSLEWGRGNFDKGWKAISEARDTFISGSVISFAGGRTSVLTLLGLAFLNAAIYKYHEKFREEHNAFVLQLALHLTREEVPGPNHDELLVLLELGILSGMHLQSYPEVAITAQESRLRNLASYLFAGGRYWEGCSTLWRLAPDLHEAGLLPTAPIPPLWEAFLLSKGLLSPPVQEIGEFNYDAFNRFENLINDQSPLCFRNDYTFFRCRKQFIEISSQKTSHNHDESLYLSLLACLDEVNISLTRQGHFERDHVLNLKALIAKLYGNPGTYLDIQEERLRLYEDFGRLNSCKVELRLATLETIAKFPNGIHDIGAFLGDLNEIEKSLENEPNPSWRERYKYRLVILHERALHFLNDFGGSISKEFGERLSKSDDVVLKAWGGAVLAKAIAAGEPRGWRREVDAWVAQRKALLKKYPNISLPKPPPTLSLDGNDEPTLELREWAKEFGKRLSKSDDVLLEALGGAILAKLNVLGEPPDWQREVDAWVAQREALLKKYPNISLPEPPTLSLDWDGEPTLELRKWARGFGKRLSESDDVLLEALGGAILARLNVLGESLGWQREVDAWVAQRDALLKKYPNISLPKPPPTLSLGWNGEPTLELREWAKEFGEKLSESDDVLLKAWGGAILAKLSVLGESPDWQREVDAWVAQREALLKKYPNTSLPKQPPTLSLDRNGDPPLELREWAKEFGKRLSESDDVLLKALGGAILAKLNVLGGSPVLRRAADAWAAWHEALMKKYPNISPKPLPALSLDKNGDPTHEFGEWVRGTALGAEVDSFEQYAVSAVVSLEKLLPKPAKQLPSRTVGGFGTARISVSAHLDLPVGGGPVSLVYRAGSVANSLSQVPNLGNCSKDTLAKLKDIRWNLEQLPSNYSSESFSSAAMSGYLLASIAELLISATWTLQGDWEKVYMHLDKASLLVDKGRSQRSYTNTKETWNQKREVAAEIILKIIHNVGLYLLLRAGESWWIWDWVQRGKARGLADAMNTAIDPRDNQDAKDVEPTAQLFQKLRMRRANAETSSNLRGRASGSVPNSYKRLCEVKTHLENLGHKKFKFIDWVVFDPDVLLSDREAPIRMFVVSATDPIEMLDIVDAEKKPMTVDILTNWVGKTVRLADPARGGGEPDPFSRTRRTLSENALEEINCLVEPLDGRIVDDELLIFSASGPLRDIPLHALSPRGIGKQGVNSNRMILDSNPVIYATSLEVLEACFSRGRGNHSVHKACFFNAMPDSSPKDMPETETVQDAVERVARMWGESSTFHRTQVTRETFCSESQDSTFINFMGHAVPERRRKDSLEHPSSDPHGDSLLLPDDSRWEVTDTLKLNLRKLSPLVMLIACETGQEEFMEGEEPVGMISGFLLVGASTVIGTLWKTPDNAGLRFLTLFNEHLNRNAESDINIVSRAKAFQSAVKELRETPGKTPGKKEFASPYFWAPFVLHGAP